MKKILIPILLLPLAFTSCKKHQIKKQTKQVAGTCRGQMESYHEQTHWGDSMKVFLDTAYNSVKEVVITIEKKDDDQIFVSDGYGSGTLLKYAGHNMQSTIHDWGRYYDSEYAIVYYPSTDSLFTIRKHTGANNQYPPKQYLTNYYFKGKRISN